MSWDGEVCTRKHFTPPKGNEECLLYRYKNAEQVERAGEHGGYVRAYKHMCNCYRCQMYRKTYPDRRGR